MERNAEILEYFKSKTRNLFLKKMEKLKTNVTISKYSNQKRINVSSHIARSTHLTWPET